MATSTIEREILLDAPADPVWAAVTEPDGLSQWWPDSAEVDLRPGGEGTLVWNGGPNEGTDIVQIMIESMERPHNFSFRWLNPRGTTDPDGKSVLIEFTLTPEGDGTRLRIMETWPREMVDPSYDRGEGWEPFLARLRDLVARSQKSKP